MALVFSNPRSVLFKPWLCVSFIRSVPRLKHAYMYCIHMTRQKKVDSRKTFSKGLRHNSGHVCINISHTLSEPTKYHMCFSDGCLSNLKNMQIQNLCVCWGHSNGVYLLTCRLASFPCRALLNSWLGFNTWSICAENICILVLEDNWRTGVGS